MSPWVVTRHWVTAPPLTKPHSSAGLTTSFAAFALAPGAAVDLDLTGDPLTGWSFGPLPIVERRLMLEEEGTSAAVLGVGESTILLRDLS